MDLYGACAFLSDGISKQQRVSNTTPLAALFHLPKWRKREIWGKENNIKNHFRKNCCRCSHGHGIPSIDCQVGMECISGYEDALNMSADARFKFHTNNDEPKYTCHQIWLRLRLRVLCGIRKYCI